MRRDVSGPTRTSPFGVAASALLVLATLIAVPVGAGDQVPEGRVVAVGDLHGNIDALVSILEKTGLIDGDRRWAGGSDTLVQLGDILDRGERVREVLDFLKGLQVEAAAVGGRVVVLLGNHEVMDLLGVIREVDPGAYAAFVDEQSEQRRRDAFEEFVRYQSELARYMGAGMPALGEEVRRAWFDAYPPGKVEYMAALLPDGEYGGWIRSWPAVLRIGATVFVHGGLGPTMKGRDLEGINRTVADELDTFDRMREYMADLNLVQRTSSVHLMSQVAEAEMFFASQVTEDSSLVDRQRASRAEPIEALSGWKEWLISDQAGPLWNGAPSFWDEEDDASEVAELLTSFGVEHMVVAHIPRRDGRILQRFDGRLFVIDTWMEHYPGKGAVAALEIDGGVFTPVYLAQETSPRKRAQAARSDA
jgi:hypothetical protein